MQARIGVVLAGAGLAFGIFFGRALAQRDADGEIAKLVGERDALKARLDKAEADAASPRPRDTARRPRESHDPNVPSGMIPPDMRTPSDGGAAAPSREPPKAGAPTAEQRANRLNELRGGLATLFEQKDGEKLMAAMKELAAIVPEGRDDAMKLAIDLNKDVNGAGELHLSQFVFYGALGDPGVKDLMLWSLENQASSPSDFRVMAAWSIPWALKPDDAIARYDAALGRESDRGVQRAIVSNLSSMNTPKAESVLAKVFGDTTRDAALRGEAAMALATSKDAAIQRAIEAAALGDPEPKVQAAAKISLIVRDPPATGWLVVQTQSDGNAEAAGVRAGDIIVAYNGKAIASNEELVRERDAAQAGGAESIAMTVVRDGREMPLTVKPGRLGLTNGQTVKKK